MHTYYRSTDHIAALIILPMFIDVQKYKPLIEKEVSKATGRTFTIGDEIKLSLFPLAILSFNNLHLGNPPGFEEKDFVSIKQFDARVKLFAFLLSRFKEIKVKRFIIEEPRIVMETQKDGRNSLDGIVKAGETKPKAEQKPKEGKPAKSLPIQTFTVDEFAITNGTIILIDHSKGDRKEISAINLKLDDLSLDQPISIFFSALVEKYPFSLEGSAGPLGKDLNSIGKGTMHIDLSFTALNHLKMDMKGNIIDPATDPRFDLTFNTPSFSPRKMMSSINQPFPVKTTDPKAFEKVGLSFHVNGDKTNVSISDGLMLIDDSNLTFTASAGEFSKPKIAFDVNLDGIDLDRYMPEKEKIKPKGEKEKKAKPQAAKKKKTDYAPLRKLELDGKVKIGNLKVSNVKIQNINVKISGRNGIFKIHSATLAMYDGSLAATSVLNVTQERPKTDIQLKVDSIQIAPLIKDLLNKEYIEGTTHANISLGMVGDDPKIIKKTLNGDGELLFKDGAIIGIDLLGMVSNVESAFSVSLEDEQQPKTEFTELRAPFTITNGVLNTSGTILKSPVLQTVTTGKANLPKETLDFTVEPRFVATSVDKAKTAEAEDEEKKKVTEIKVPVLITGTFSDPKFRPDLRKILQNAIEDELFESKEFKKIFKKEELKLLEDTTKDLIRGILKKK
ncbi:MAG: AsmA family protein [Deltaproteobacteria bacterium]|nr:AsmA family protein [Deltaproteobacteria bacterium]